MTKIEYSLIGLKDEKQWSGLCFYLYLCLQFKYLYIHWFAYKQFLLIFFLEGGGGVWADLAKWRAYEVPKWNLLWPSPFALKLGLRSLYSLYPLGHFFVKSELNRDKGKEYDPDKESAMTCDLKAWFKVTAHPTLYQQTLWVN